MTRLLQLVILATALISALAAPVASLMADGGGPWPVPPNAHLVDS
jgi:hypothetical protein